MSTQRTLLLLLLFLLHHTSAQQILNPVSTPPTNTSRAVIIRKFAQLPRFRNRPQPIVSTTPFRTSLYIVVNINAHIYRVAPSGAVTLWFNANTTLFDVTNRRINFDRFLHGGLRSIAFHPRFATNRLVYTAHVETRTAGRRYLSTPRDALATEVDSVVGEWRVGRDGFIVGGSYREVLRIGMPVYDHTIREMRFRGRFLYIGHGDGAAQNNTKGGGQNSDGLGKILRVDPLGRDAGGYGVPRGNPFVGRRGMLDEVWAVGFRNPHNMCFGKGGTLFVVDVGRDNVEEVNIVQRGGNYGWSRREGLFVHLEGDGGIFTGIRRRLPRDDARFGFTYPNAVVGHFGELGAGFVFQALTGSCPIQNGSPLDGVMLYANFPSDGQLYFSTLNDLRAAVTRGEPNELTQATTFVPRVFFEKVVGGRTTRVQVENLREIVRMEEDFRDVARTDVRFGQGRFGEIYWTSKQNGAVYLVTNSLPPARAKQVLRTAKRVAF